MSAANPLLASGHQGVQFASGYQGQPQFQLTQDQIKQFQSEVAHHAQIVHVPKIVTQERIVEVPQIQYVDKQVERIVEVPQVQWQTVIKEVQVPHQVPRPVPVERIVEVPQHQVVYRDVPVEVIQHREVPRPVEVEVQQIRHVPREVIVNRPVPVQKIVEQRIDVPVYKQVARQREVPVAIPTIRKVETPVPVHVPHVIHHAPVQYVHQVQHVQAPPQIVQAPPQYVQGPAQYVQAPATVQAASVAVPQFASYAPQGYGSVQYGGYPAYGAPVAYGGYSHANAALALDAADGRIDGQHFGSRIV